MTTEETEAYRLFHPADPGPVVVDVPHAGRELPSWAAAPLTLEGLARDRDGDLYVDRLAEQAPSLGAPLLVARATRYAVDLNRAESDVDGLAVEGRPDEPAFPRGLIWRLTTDGAETLARRLTAAELEQRLTRLHRPYRARLAALLDAAVGRHGVAVLLDAHSCPSVARAGHADTGRRPDAILGWRGGTTCGEPLLAAAEEVLRRSGLRTSRDEPYRGGDLVATFAAPAAGRHALQLELSRALYMDEERLLADEAAVVQLQAMLGELVEALAAAALSDRRPTRAAAAPPRG